MSAKEVEFFDLSKEYLSDNSTYSVEPEPVENYQYVEENYYPENIYDENYVAPPMYDQNAVLLSENVENTFLGQGSEEVIEPLISREEKIINNDLKRFENRKVLLVNTVAGTGSVGRLVTGLYDALTDRGFECLIAYGRGELSGRYNGYRIGDDFSVNYHGIMTRLTDKHCFYSKTATKEFIKVIEDFDPEIIHLHNVHGYYLNIEILFKYLKESGRRIIWTLHDCWTFTGHCSHFEYIGCTKWQTGCFKCEQLKEYPASMYKDNSSFNFRKKLELFTGIPDLTIVTPSEWLKEKVSMSFLSEYPVIVVPTGIDLNNFAPYYEEDEEYAVIKQLKNGLGVNGKTVLLGVANPWRERKGLNQFEALSKLVNEKYKIVMLGLTDKQVEALPPNIIGLKKTESVSELAALYSLADIYINLTLEDTFPTTNIEALACGTPVVTYKSGGSAESIDETCGIAVERNSLQGVVAAIENIVATKGISFTVNDCLRRARLYDKEYRFNEYIKEVYEGLY